MNDLTEKVVRETALEHKALAKKNDLTFDFKVRDNHWGELIDLHGARMKMRAVEIWRWFHPEMFMDVGDGDWVLDDGAGGWVFDADLELSQIVGRVLRRKRDRDPALWLDDWGDYPVRVVDPQLSLGL